MANLEHIERLKRNIEEWNTWRQDHPGIQPDLSHAHLIYTHLSETKLSCTHLSYADLSYANLSGANLSHAQLSHANLSYANLSYANLSHTNLSYANLSGTNLSNTNFNQAYFLQTVFAWVDLSLVKGLEAARYNGPSIVHINSITLPHDEPTRNHFLRGVGFNETQIEYLPSLLTPRPIQYHSLFISYASRDKAIAQRLHTDLRKKDVPCWFALHDLQPGNYFRERIDQAIQNQDKLLLLLSEHSVQSGWVRYEVETAIEKENQQRCEVLFPVRLDNTVMQTTQTWAAQLRSSRHIGDFTNWQDNVAYQQALSRLLRDLKVVQPVTIM